jgi:predicted lipoprotein
VFFWLERPHQAIIWRSQVSENEDSDRLALSRLLQEAKLSIQPMFPDQQKKWVAQSPLAQGISAILVKHPEYYDEVRAHVGGIFPKPKMKSTKATQRRE